MTRWRRLVANVGWGGALRTVIAFALMGAVVVVAAAVEQTLLPVTVYLAGALLPALLRRALVDRVEQVAPALQAYALALAVVAFAAGFLRGLLWEAGHPLEWPVFLIAMASVGCYLSAFFWVFSDPEVVRLEE